MKKHYIVSSTVHYVADDKPDKKVVAIYELDERDPVVDLFTQIHNELEEREFYDSDFGYDIYNHPLGGLKSFIVLKSYPCHNEWEYDFKLYPLPEIYLK